MLWIDAIDATNNVIRITVDEAEVWEKIEIGGKFTIHFKKSGNNNFSLVSIHPETYNGRID
ncbi:hypothetical protein [Paenibacillus flagellatus]|uniref:hypothetical protein n=1 Tax=Paenibacillus flagellatus TaxID=2211139 RepID=UPI0011B367A5|nr:hypothetical protein [Paenibacillus flagellatus]